MAETSRNLDIALRIRADLKSATDGLRALENEIRKTGQTADEAGVQTKKLANANDSAAAAMSRSEKQARSLGIAIGVMVAAMTAAGVALVKSTLDYDQKLGDMSKKVGASTETLSALGDVARKNGSDLQGVQRGFVDLARAATDGSSRAARALTAMGIPLKEFQSLTSSQRFDLVAQKFAGYADGANKAALATALFGQRGVELIPTLNQVGNEGLQNITDKAIAAGTAVGQDAVDASNAFSNALADLRAKLQGAVNGGLVQFTPYIEQLSNLINDPQFQENLKATAQGIAAVGIAAINAANGVVTFVRGAAEVLAFQRTGIIASETGYQAALTRLNADKAELAKRAPEDANAFTQLNEKSARLRRAVFTTSDSVTHAALKDTKDLTTEVADLTAKTDAYAKSRKAANSANADTVLTGDKVPAWMKVGLGGKTDAPIVPGKTPTTRADTSAQREAEKIARDAARAQDQLTQSLIQMQGQLDPTAQAWATYNAAVKKANDEAALAKKAPGADPAAIDSQRDAVIGLAATIRDAALDKLADQDRQAWQRLKDSLRDPVEVATDKAVAQLQELNRLMVQLKGTKDEISPQEYADTVKRIADKSVTQAPQYQGLDAAVGGIGSELSKNFRAQADLDKWHQDQLKANEAFRAKDAGNEQAYQERLAEIDRQYAQQRQVIEQSRGQLMLQTASGIFGQLATLSSSHNKKMAAIGKAAAIAQAIINTYQSATEAYASLASIPYIGPALGAAAAAAAIAAGLANVAQIRSQNVGGYAEGGYTGPGSKHTPAGIVHAGEVVWSQADIARAGGVGIVETMRLRGYADGGVVAPFANVPSPDQLGFRDLPRPAVRLPSADAGNAGSRAPQVGVRIINAIDPQFVTDGMASSEGEQIILNTIARNRMRVKQTIG